MSGNITLGYGLLIFFFVMAGFLVLTYNKLAKLKVNVGESFSTMDVYLKKRYELIPNLVETVKGYENYETKALKTVIDARNQALNGRSTDEVIAANSQISRGLGTIFALAESYPDLKANTTYLNLQDSLNQVEKDIASSRLYYNGCVKQLNRAILVFPTILVASLFGFKTMSFYEAANDERQPVKVQLRD